DVVAVMGQNLELISERGGIGEAESRLVVRAAGTVNARAEADIYLEAEGDLRSDRVQSRRGSVDLSSRGGSIEVNELWLAVPDGASEQEIHLLASPPTFARFHGRVIRIEDLAYGGSDPLELAFRGENGLA